MLRSTDWVADDTVGAEDLFDIDNQTDVLETRHGVMVWACAKYEDAPATYKMVVSSNGTETKSANITCGSDWQYDGFVVEDDPDTSNAWDQTGINAMLTGFEVQ
jgi:hypothetical protein